MDQTPQPRSGCLPGGCLGMVLGLVISLWWVNTYPPVQTGGCGMDRAFGVMGVAIFSSLGGGLAVALLGAVIDIFFSE